MDLTVDIKTDSRYPVDRNAVRLAVAKILNEKGVEGKVYVSVRVVGDRMMRNLNRSYRKLDKTTDVLSFPTIDPSQDLDMHGYADPEDAGLILGDIVVSYPVARIEAAEKNMMLDEVIGGLVEHGMLHLLGYHHD